ncbi:MAG: WecB/TagA/CpsF family glycosyltransferase [Bacilli bacterium]
MKALIEKTYNDYLLIKEIGIDKYLKNNKKAFIVTVNPEACMISENSRRYQQLLLDKDTLLIPESVGCEIGIKKICNKTIEKIPGVELFEDILKFANENSKSIYLYGSIEKVNNDMKTYVKKHYKNIIIVGSNNGYDKEEAVIMEDIIKTKPDIIAVALGMPKQELFINKIYKNVKKGIFIGVGGTFDVLSGNVKRAPKFFIKHNLEWLYRICGSFYRVKKFFRYNVKYALKIYFYKKD